MKARVTVFALAVALSSCKAERTSLAKLAEKAAPIGTAEAAAQNSPSPNGPNDLWVERGPNDPLPPGVVPMPSLGPLVNTLKPAVVNISTTQMVKPRGGDPLEEFFGRQQGNEAQRKSLGSGFIISPRGFIISNNHVVEGADEIRVKLNDGREFEAEAVGTDPKTDTALLKLKTTNGTEPKNLPIVPLGNSEDIVVGDFVLAVGNPFGLDESVSLGIVSAKERVIGAGPYDDFIQTDAAINPGNSGGPLFNTKGEVIGVNTAIVAHGQGIGFAIPINMVKKLLPQLAQSGHVTRGWLGVSIQDVTPEIARMLKLDRPQGALIAGIMRGSPAESGGLKAGDIVTNVNGKKVDTYNQLSRLVAFINPGGVAKLTVLRDGKEQTLDLKVGVRPEDDELANAKVQQKAMPGGDKLGVSVGPLSQAQASRGDAEGGVVVREVKPDGPAARAGIQQGDVIVELQRRPVRNVTEYANALAGLRAGEMALIRLQRQSASVYVAIRIPR